MARLRAKLTQALRRRKRADAERLYGKLFELLPRNVPLFTEYAAFALPAGWPETPVPARGQAIARALHERIAAALDARPPLDPNLARELRRLDTRVLAWAEDPTTGLNTAIAACGRLDDDGFLTLQSFATWRLLQADRERAIAAYEAARRCASHRHEVLQDLGALRLTQGQASEALRLFREALPYAPEDPERRRDLAAALLALGETQEAITHLERACQTPSTRCLLDLAAAHAEAQHHDRVAQLAQQALTLAAATDPEPSLVLGAAYAAQGRATLAREAYQEALRRAPDDPRAQRSLNALERSP